MMRVFLVALGLAVVWSCQPNSISSVTAETLKADVQFLASDALEGRRAGEPGADLAADWIADRLAKAGIQPGGEDGGWFQAVQVSLPPRKGHCSLAVAGKEFADVGTVAASASSAAHGELVSAGYGLVLASHGLDDFAAAGVQGKIVLVRRGTPFGPDPGPELGSLGALRGKIRAAAEEGAIGIILGTHPDDQAAGFEPEITFASVPGKMKIPVVTVGPSQFADLENGPGAEVEMVAEVTRESATTRNVLGWLPASDNSGQAILVGAHYDHLGRGGNGSLAPGSEEIHNGADDNASGVAVVLAVAEALAGTETRANRGVVFAFWAAEEEGLLGSAHWARNPLPAGVRVVAGINLDMVGRPSEGRITAGSLETAAAFGRTLAQAEHGKAIEITRSAGRLPGGGGSDHMSLHGIQIPCAFLFSGLHTDYHKPTDDWQHLDYPRMVSVVKLVAAWTQALRAAAPASLAWVAPPPEPDRGPVQGAGAWFGSVPDYAAQPEGGGMQLAGVSPGGPAQAAGLRKGDILKMVGETTVNDIYDFMDALAAGHPGEKVTVEFIRDGKVETVAVVLGSRAAD
jgi:hypothetical protein